MGESGQAGDEPAGVGPPVRREEAREGGDDHHAAVVRHRGRGRLDLLGRGDDPEAVAKPLHERPGHGHGPLEGVAHRLPRPLVGDRGDEAVRRRRPLRPRVLEQEAAGPVGVLRVPGAEERLAEARGLLVPQHPRHGDARQRLVAGDLAEHAHRGHDARRHRLPLLGVEPEELEHGGAPSPRLEVHQQGARGVRHVGDVDPAVDAAREVPHEPRVHGSDPQPPRGRQRAGLRDLVQDPADLGRGEVGGQGQAGAGAGPGARAPGRAR